MNGLRSDQQAALAALHARGEEVAERYRAALTDPQLPAAWRELLAAILARHESLVEGLAAAERASGDLPKAGNLERASLQVLLDRLTGLTGSRVAVARRLSHADEVWREELRQVRGLTWSAEEMALLDALEAHLGEAAERLRSLTG